MNIDTIVGIVVIAGIIFAAKLIDKSQHSKQKNKYLIRIENEFKDSLNTFANTTLEEMSAHYRLNISLRKLTTELDFAEVDEK